MIEFWVRIAQKLPVIVLILISASSVVFGDYLAKSWSVSHRGWLFLGAFIFYGFASIFYIPTLLREGLVVTSVLWSILSIVGFLLIGLLVFKESLTLMQWIGVGFGVVSLILLSVYSA